MGKSIQVKVSPVMGRSEFLIAKHQMLHSFEKCKSCSLRIREKLDQREPFKVKRAIGQP